MHSSKSQYMQPTSHTASTSTSTVPPPMTATSSTQIRPASPPRPSFYLPSPTTTTDALSRAPSRHDPLSSRFSLSLSVPGSPSSRPLGLGHSHHRSRSSLAALRSALQTYQVPDPDETNVDSGGVYTPVHGQRRPTRRSSRSDEPVSDLDLYSDTFGNEDMERPYHQRRHSYQHSERGMALQSPFGTPISQEMMDALVEIHRVLYRGREDMETFDGRSRTLKWDEQGKEVKRVVERWFEGDCRYDHPLAQVSSRDSLLTHFILLHLMSTLYLPAISPSALVQHAKSLTSALRTRLLGDNEVNDLEGVTKISRSTASVKGKEKAEELDLPTSESGVGWRLPPTSTEGGGEKSGWWKAWDVSADCREIGGMECYDGYHLALIEHTITLTLFPSLSSRTISSVPSSPATYASDDHRLLTARISPPSFLARLAQSMAEELDYLLHWDLPISTFVEFNEVGKATRIRDVVDVRDAIETFVPFAKRVGWLTRRLAGIATSTLGAIALGLTAGPNVRLTQGIRVEGSNGTWDPVSQNLFDEKIKSESASGLGLGDLDLDMDMKMGIRRPLADKVMSGGDSEPNSLGLDGVDPVGVADSDLDSVEPDSIDEGNTE